MQVFFVSLRTEKITGPGEITEISDEGGGQALLFFEAEDLSFKEWQGYAIVVPAEGRVWGAGKPEKQQSGTYTCRFAFTPQPIPEGDLKLFKVVEG